MKLQLIFLSEGHIVLRVVDNRAIICKIRGRFGRKDNDQNPILFALSGVSMKMKKVGGRKDVASRSRDLVAHYACGNVSIQIKRYVTAAEKEERKRRVLAVKFI